ncbi:hypothetical protein ACIPJK_39240 [Streptomyces roseus]|uniref:hypothetical protein n=1 Tax=Streptomyces roseus TaxID=66430 RepID=UPI00381AA665
MGREEGTVSGREHTMGKPVTRSMTSACHAFRLRVGVLMLLEERDGTGGLAGLAVTDGGLSHQPLFAVGGAKRPGAGGRDGGAFLGEGVTGFVEGSRDAVGGGVGQREGAGFLLEGLGTGARRQRPGAVPGGRGEVEYPTWIVAVACLGLRSRT